MTLYAIGDIQGCARAFERLLDVISFNPKRDQLWLVGDLVNRGPDSLAVLRRVISLGENATVVLGNHDLHLLAVAAGVRDPGPNDTFNAILKAPDTNEILDWMRQRPLLHHDASAKRVLVHAGLPPCWSMAEATQHAGEISDLLQSNSWRKNLKKMYGNEPKIWSQKLSGEERHRFTINALTRIRFCDKNGKLDFEYSCKPGSQPAQLMPWFDVPGRLNQKTHVVFGHWATLGIVCRPDVTALDSGCVWGGALTAIPLEPAGEKITVDCGSIKD